MMQAAMRGKIVGVGLEVGVEKGVLVVTRLTAKAPAVETGLKVKDRVVRVGAVAVADLPAEDVARQLRGDPGSKIEVEVVRDGEKRTFTLVRRAVLTPSVTWKRDVLHDGSPVGYIRIYHFDAATARDVKAALKELTRPADGVKGLILDLRGNPGGLFRSALSVLELFLSEGVAAIGESPFEEYHGPFRIESRDAVQLPLVVLVDSETASSAEVLAGALKETRSTRAPTRLVGQTTYGKGSVQALIPLNRAAVQPTGLRLTVARLFSPTNQPYTGRGITPDLLSDKEDEELLAEARVELHRLVHPGMGPSSMVMPPAGP